jgi:hypothetical protein
VRKKGKINVERNEKYKKGRNPFFRLK